MDEITLCDTVCAEWIFFLEHFIKTLKGFVMQNASHKGGVDVQHYGDVIADIHIRDAIMHHGV